MSEKILQATREFTAKEGTKWSKKEQADQNISQGMWALQSLRMFLQEEDQVTAIRNWLLVCLRDLEIFKAENPDLPWAK